MTYKPVGPGEVRIDGDPVDVLLDAEFIAHARTDVPALVAALREARAEVDHLTDLLADVNDSAGQWRRRYDALRDGVTGLEGTYRSHIGPHDAGEVLAYVVSDLRTVVARVEGDES